MYFQSKNYRLAESYESFSDEMSEIPIDQVEKLLDIRFDDSAKQLFETLIDPLSVQAEIDISVLDFALVAQAAHAVDPLVEDSIGLGWITKARRKLLETWADDYDENSRIDIRKTPFFDDQYSTRCQLEAVSSSRCVPSFDYEPRVFATGIALGRIGIGAE